MHDPLERVMLIVTSLCFLLATFNIRARINLVALGLLFWVLLRGFSKVFT